MPDVWARGSNAFLTYSFPIFNNVAMLKNHVWNQSTDDAAPFPQEFISLVDATVECRWQNGWIIVTLLPGISIKLVGETGRQVGRCHDVLLWQDQWIGGLRPSWSTSSAYAALPLSPHKSRAILLGIEYVTSLPLSVPITWHKRSIVRCTAQDVLGAGIFREASAYARALVAISRSWPGLRRNDQWNTLISGNNLRIICT